MANVTIDASGNASLNLKTATGRYLVAISPSILYCFYIDNASDPRYRKSIDGGASWEASVSLKTGTVEYISVWYDRWTPGDNGTKIHIWYIDTGVDDCFYRDLNIVGDSLGSEITVFAGATAAPLSGLHVTGTKSRGGILTCTGTLDGGTENIRHESTDGGANWTTIADPNEAGGNVSMLFPGNEADADDLWLIYWEFTADLLELKVLDHSANSWSVTTISTAMNLVGANVAAPQVAGSIRHSDGHLILVAWSDFDVATADLRCWDINGSGSITAKTDVVTNADDCACAGLFIDQNNDRIFVFYIGEDGGTETFGSTVNIYYKGSADGGSNWNSPGETLYSEAGGDFYGISVDLGGSSSLLSAAWLIDAATDDVTFNAVNAVYIGPPAGLPQPRIPPNPIREILRPYGMEDWRQLEPEAPATPPAGRQDFPHDVRNRLIAQRMRAVFAALETPFYSVLAGTDDMIEAKQEFPAYIWRKLPKRQDWTVQLITSTLLPLPEGKQEFPDRYRWQVPKRIDWSWPAQVQLIGQDAMIAGDQSYPDQIDRRKHPVTFDIPNMQPQLLFVQAIPEGEQSYPNKFIVKLPVRQDYVRAAQVQLISQDEMVTGRQSWPDYISRRAPGQDFTKLPSPVEPTGIVGEQSYPDQIAKRFSRPFYIQAATVRFISLDEMNAGKQSWPDLIARRYSRPSYERRANTYLIGLDAMLAGTQRFPDRIDRRKPGQDFFRRANTHLIGLDDMVAGSQAFPDILLPKSRIRQDFRYFLNTLATIPPVPIFGQTFPNPRGYAYPVALRTWHVPPMLLLNLLFSYIELFPGNVGAVIESALRGEASVNEVLEALASLSTPIEGNAVLSKPLEGSSGLVIPDSEGFGRRFDP